MPMACFPLVTTLHGRCWLGLRLWTPPQPGAKPEILTHPFPGNQQRLCAAVAARSVPAACIVPSPQRSPLGGHSSRLERGSRAQPCILPCHSNVISDAVLHFGSQGILFFVFSSSHRKDYALTFLKSPLNFNSCSQPALRLTFKEASQFPSTLSFPSKTGKSEERLKKNYRKYRKVLMALIATSVCLVSTCWGRVFAFRWLISKRKPVS